MSRTISSSVVRAQSCAARFTRKVLETLGEPLFLIRAFHVPAVVLIMVAMCTPPADECTHIVPFWYFSQTRKNSSEAESALSH
jgi:hypothetical protein